ncbi:hypothetical protein Emag_001843 [Eimeria magna]
MPSSTSSPSALKLNVTNSRLWGNIVGIAAAVLVSYCPPCFSSETEVRYLCRSLMGDCSRCITLIGNAFVRSVLPPAEALDKKRGGQLQQDEKTSLGISAQEQTDSTTEQGITFAAECGVPSWQLPKKRGASPLAFDAAHANANGFSEFSVDPLSAELEEAPCKREREARWKRGFFGIGFLAKPETFSRLPVSMKLSHERDDNPFWFKQHNRHKRKEMHLNLKEKARALKAKHLNPHFWRKRQHSTQLVS